MSEMNKREGCLLLSLRELVVAVAASVVFALIAPFVPIVQQKLPGVAAILNPLAPWRWLIYFVTVALTIGLAWRLKRSESRIAKPSTTHKNRVAPKAEPKYLSCGPSLIAELGNYFCASGRAKDLPENWREFEESDDNQLLEVVRELPTFGDVNFASVPGGVVFGNREGVNSQNFQLSKRAAWITNQGQVVIFFSQQGAHILFDLFLSLASVYYICRCLVNKYNVSPDFSFEFCYRTDETSYPPGMLGRPIYQQWYSTDVRRPFAEAAVDPVLTCLRSGTNSNGYSRDDISQALQDFWDNQFSTLTFSSRSAQRQRRPQLVASFARQREPNAGNYFVVGRFVNVGAMKAANVTPHFPYMPESGIFLVSLDPGDSAEMTFPYSRMAIDAAVPAEKGYVEYSDGTNLYRQECIVRFPTILGSSVRGYDNLPLSSPEIIRGDL